MSFYYYYYYYYYYHHHHHHHHYHHHNHYLFDYYFYYHHERGSPHNYLYQYLSFIFNAVLFRSKELSIICIRAMLHERKSILVLFENANQFTQLTRI